MNYKMLNLEAENNVPMPDIVELSEIIIYKL